jgi:diguanylate cyclase (GGDEF)-like protein
VLVVDKNTLTIRHANECAAAFFLREGGSFGGTPVGDVVGGDAELMLAQVWNNAPIGKLGHPFLIRSLVNDQQRMLMVRATKIIAGEELLRLFTFTDVPPAEPAALAGWHHNMMEVLNWLPCAVEIDDNEDEIQFANAQTMKLFGYSQDDLQSAGDWWRLAYPDPEYREFARQKWETEVRAARAENREMTPFDLDVATASGECRTIQFHHRTIGSFNVNLYLDVTRERAYERELRALAETDSLTGAMNRRRFFEEARALLSAETESPIGVLMLDLDHFKTINDAYGHGEGDAVLREFTLCVEAVLRPNDRLARLGGEEFAVLLPATRLDVAGAIAERLRAAVSNHPFRIGQKKLSVTTSIGGTCCAIDEPIDAAISRADKALYGAKREGRNRVIMISAQHP